VISAVTSFGAFVELEEPFVEGLIKLDSLGDDEFSYDEVHMRLSGQRTGITLELGDKVTVEINNVSVVRRRIDFTLITAQSAGRKVRKAPDKGGPRPSPGSGSRSARRPAARSSAPRAATSSPARGRAAPRRPAALPSSASGLAPRSARRGRRRTQAAGQAAQVIR